MKRRRRCQLAVEHLEDRLVPTLRISSLPGTLIISGTPVGGPTDELRIDMPAPGKIRIRDLNSMGGTINNYGTFQAPSTLQVNLTSYNTSITFDVNGNTFGGNVNFSLGNGDTDLSSVNPVSIVDLLNAGAGAVGGNVTITGGSGNEFIGLGETSLGGSVGRITIKG